MNNLQGNALTESSQTISQEDFKEIFSNVLGVEEVDMDLGFLAQGGNSIKAIRVMTQLQEFEIELNPQDLLDAGTLSSLFGDKVISSESMEKIGESKKVMAEMTDFIGEPTFYESTNEQSKNKNVLECIFLETLEISALDINQGFLAQNGDSIKAIQIAARLKEEVGIEIDTENLLASNALSEVIDFEKSNGDFFGERPSAKIVLKNNDDLMLSIIKETLDIDQLDLSQDFLAHGGDSIKAIQIAARLKEEVGIALNPETLLANDQLSTILLHQTTDQKKVSNESADETQIIENDQSLSGFQQAFLSDYENNADFDYLKISYQNEQSRGLQQLTAKLPTELMKHIEKLSVEANVDIETILATIWGITLQKYHFIDDVVFSKIVTDDLSGKIDLNKKQVFKYTVPVRVMENGETNFSELIQTLQTQIRKNEQQNKTLINQEEKIKTAFIFATQNLLSDVEWWKDSPFDVVMGMAEAESLHFYLNYRETLFEQLEMQRLLDSIVQLTHELIAKPNVSLKNISLVSGEEKRQLDKNIHQNKKMFSDTVVPLKVHELARKMPDQPAIRFMGKTLTYRELDQQADKVAQILLEKGLREEEVVGIYLEKTPLTIVVMLGVMKAGGACLTIDVAQPMERVAYMLSDADAKLLVTAKEISETFFAKQQIIDINQIDFTKSVDPICIPTSVDQLAYIIYTSGSTGKPKGSLTPYRGLLNLTDYFQRQLGIGTEDVIQQFSSLSFDASILEIFITITNGATLVIVPNEIRQNPEDLVDFWNKERVTFALVPPALMNYMPIDKVETLRYMVNGGEAADPNMAYRWSQKMTYINAYGPSEATVITTMWFAEKLSEVPKVAPIGKPIQNVNIYILNGEQIVADGMPGELCIGGSGLSSGYYNRADLNQEKFVSLPDISEEKIYRTGDLCRRLPNGDLVFLGRIDNQVKIHSYRIEVGEVEKNIRQLATVKDVVVTAEKQSGSHFLVAYVVMDKDQSISAIKEFLAETLPDYMIPERFILLDRLPMTVNGKVDRRKLTETLLKTQVEQSVTSDSYQPVSKMEQILIDAISDAVGQPVTTIDSTYLELGGDSISALRVAYLCKDNGVDVPVRSLISELTIREIIQELTGTISEDKQIAQEKAGKVYADFGEMLIKVADADLAPLKNITREYQKNIEGIETIDAYKANLIQKVMASESNVSGHVLGIEGDYTPEQIQDAVRKIITDQSSLRSSYTKKGLKVQIHEYPMVDNWKIPFKSIQDLNETEQKQLFRDEQLLFFDMDVFPPGKLSSDIRLYQLSDTKYKLYVRVHHLFWDAKSSEIFEKLLYACLNPELATYPETVTHYKEYLEMLKTDKRGKSNIKLLDKLLSVKTFFKASSKYSRRGGLKRRNMHAKLKIKMSPTIKQRVYKDTWGIIAYIAGILNHHIYLSKDVEDDFPVIFLHHGREGKVARFNQTLGFFLDVIPMTIEKGNAQTMNQQINQELENYKKLREQTSLTFPEYAVKKKALTKVPGVLGLPMLNFLGFFSFGNETQEESFYAEEIPFKTPNKELIIGVNGDLLEIDLFATENEAKKIYNILRNSLGR